jgi:hypothetical protein
MNYRIAKKIVTCKSSLHKNYNKVVQARQVIKDSGKPGWLFLPLDKGLYDRD